MRLTFCFSRSCTPYSRELGAALAVLARGYGRRSIGALVGVAALALEEHLHVFAPAEPTN